MRRSRASRQNHWNNCSSIYGPSINGLNKRFETSLLFAYNEGSRIMQFPSMLVDYAERVYKPTMYLIHLAVQYNVLYSLRETNKLALIGVGTRAAEDLLPIFPRGPRLSFRECLEDEDRLTKAIRDLLYDEGGNSYAYSFLIGLDFDPEEMFLAYDLETKINEGK